MHVIKVYKGINERIKTMKQIIENLMKYTRHAELVSASQVNPLLSLRDTLPQGRGNTLCAKHTVTNLSTYHLNVLKTDNTPTLSRICKFAFSSLTNSTLSQRERVKCPAFTLAETLITLGIIGIVAALTIPSIIQSRTEKATVVKLKKTYSTIQHAFDMAIAEYGPVSSWVSSNDCHQVWDKITPYMPKIVKDCTGKRGSKCFSSTYITFDTKETFYQALEWSTGCKAVFADGTAISLNHIPWWKGNISCTPGYGCILGGFFVDLNSKEKPNMDGVDYFQFAITAKGIVPLGNDLWYAGWGPGEMADTGHRTAWVIYNGNMDYLHCKDKLSWEGPFTCKEASSKK